MWRASVKRTQKQSVDVGALKVVSLILGQNKHFLYTYILVIRVEATNIFYQ